MLSKEEAKRTQLKDISRLRRLDARWKVWPFASWHLTSNARTPQQARVRVSAAPPFGLWRRPPARPPTTLMLASSSLASASVHVVGLSTLLTLRFAAYTQVDSVTADLPLGLMPKCRAPSRFGGVVVLQCATARYEAHLRLMLACVRAEQIVRV